MIHNHSDSATLPRLQSMTVIFFGNLHLLHHHQYRYRHNHHHYPHLIWTRSQSNCKASMANDPPAAERVRKSEGTDHVTSYPPPLGPWMNMRIKTTTTTITTTITLIVVIIHRRRQRRRRRGRRRCGRPRRPPPHHHEDRSQDLPTNFICLRLYLFCSCPLLVHFGDFSMDAISLPQTDSSA